MSQLHARPSIDHEPDTASIRGILLFAGILVVTLIVVIAGIFGIVRWLTTGPQRHEANAPPTAPVPQRPLTWADPAGDLARARTVQAAPLDGYHWIDESAGVVSIPIDQAMRRVAADYSRRDGPGASSTIDSPAPATNSSSDPASATRIPLSASPGSRPTTRWETP